MIKTKLKKDFVSFSFIIIVVVVIIIIIKNGRNYYKKMIN